MMTTMAAILGTLRIALGIGAGAELRQPLGGFVVSQVLTLFTIPVAYLYFERLGEWVARVGDRRSACISSERALIRAGNHPRPATIHHEPAE
jgi:hypothetical protein